MRRKTKSNHPAIRPPFLQKILQTIEEHGMIRKGEAVLAGVSGGPDSMALFHALMALSDVLNIRLGLAHLNHCLRGDDSDTDEQFVATEARRLGVPFYSKQADVRQESEKTGLSLEEAARAARYRFFDSIRKDHGFDKIALGHHLDDNAELILLYLLRGSGPSGISGIPPVRGAVVRPLIRVYRSEIMKFIQSRKIDYVIDASNKDPRFLRNKIRHELMPVLKAGYNPKIIRSLNRLGNILRMENDWISDIVAPLYDAACVGSYENRAVLKVAALRSLHPAAQGRVIRNAIFQVKGDLRRISWTHVESIVQFIQRNFSEEHAVLRMDLPDRMRVIRSADHLILLRETLSLRQAKTLLEPAAPGIFEYPVSPDDIHSRALVEVPEISARIRFTKICGGRIPDLSAGGPNTAFFDWDRLQFPIVIRNAKPGDRFTPLGAPGTQKLKKFFIDHKIPKAVRYSVPVVIGGRDIFWVGGHRISEHVKVTPKTITVLKAEILTSADLK